MNLLIAASLAFSTVSPRPITLAPITETFLQGRGSSGNLQSWSGDDQDARTVCRWLITDPRIVSVTLLKFDPGTTQIPSALELRVKVPTHTPGLQTLTILFYKTINTYEQSNIVNVPIVDGSTYTAVPPGLPESYMLANGQFQVRLEIRKGPTVSSFDPCTSFEFGNLVLTY